MLDNVLRKQCRLEFSTLLIHSELIAAGAILRRQSCDQKGYKQSGT